MDKVLFSSKTSEYGTPRYLFKMLHSLYNFTLDPSSSNSNHKCDKYYTIKENGLVQPWDHEIVFMNPPYGKGRVIDPWIKKAAMSAEADHAIVVGLLPARTDTAWFHDWVFSWARELFFIRGRLRFELDSSNYPAPFPSVLVTWAPSNRNCCLVHLKDLGIQGQRIYIR